MPHMADDAGGGATPQVRREVLREAKMTAPFAPRVKNRDDAPAEPRRRARLAPVGRRKAEMQAEIFGPQAAACRALPCVRCGATATDLNPVDPHHEPPVSQGGRDQHTVPVCRPCHDLRTRTSAERFWSDLQLDPRDVQAAVHEYMQAVARGEAAPVVWAFDGEAAS